MGENFFKNYEKEKTISLNTLLDDANHDLDGHRLVTAYSSLIVFHKSDYVYSLFHPAHSASAVFSSFLEVMNFL